MRFWIASWLRRLGGQVSADELQIILASALEGALVIEHSRGTYTNMLVQQWKKWPIFNVSNFERSHSSGLI